VDGLHLEVVQLVLDRVVFELVLVGMEPPALVLQIISLHGRAVIGLRPPVLLVHDHAVRLLGQAADMRLVLDVRVPH